jgi:2-phospho-L-lactate/phosphoenolpyruvate guanylyltransferase
MPTVVIPFAGVEGKSRLHASKRARRALSLAMLGDVLEAAAGAGAPLVVTADDEAAAIARVLGAATVADPGGGQGPAVAAALAGSLEPGRILIVNADVPCVRPADLRTLLEAAPAGGIAFVEALDGTTNALCIAAPELFAPLYGPDSASRFRSHARKRGADAVSVSVPNLADDVDTLDDLERLQLRCGPRTQACLFELPVGALQ